MSKIVSGIGKAVSGVVKGVTKAFKAVTKSKIGKILLVAAAVYLGGAALGMWESPFSAINGVLSSKAAPAAAELAAAGSGAAEATLAGAGATGEAASIAGAAEAAGGAAASASPAAAEVVAASQGSGIIGGVNPALAQQAALIESGTVGTAGAAMEASALGNTSLAGSVLNGAPAQGGGLVSKAMNGIKSVGEWAQKNPISAAIGLNAVANMSQPNQLELLDAKAQKEMELYDWKNKYLSPNWNVGAVNLGFQPAGGQQLQYRTSGQNVYGPGGNINPAVKG